MGAGSIRADRAVNPTLVFNETYADFVAAGSDTLHRIDLNIASIDATTMAGSIIDARGRRSTSPGKNQTLDVQHHAAGRRHDHRRQRQARSARRQGRQRDLPDHDQRSERRERPVPGPHQPRAAQGRQHGHDPGRVREEAGRRHADATPAARSASRRTNASPTSTHCTVDVANFGAAVGERCAERRSRARRARRSSTRTSALPARSSASGDGVQWSGTLVAGGSAAGDGDHSRQPSPAGGYLPLSLFGDRADRRRR